MQQASGVAWDRNQEHCLTWLFTYRVITSLLTLLFKVSYSYEQMQRPANLLKFPSSRSTGQRDCQCSAMLLLVTHRACLPLSFWCYGPLGCLLCSPRPVMGQGLETQCKQNGPQGWKWDWYPGFHLAAQPWPKYHLLLAQLSWGRELLVSCTKSTPQAWQACTQTHALHRTE